MSAFEFVDRAEALTGAVEDVLQRTSSWYGTMILVRRSWMAAAGLDHVEASLTRYESKMGRSMLAVELSNADGIAVRPFLPAAAPLPY